VRALKRRARDAVRGGLTSVLPVAPRRDRGTTRRPRLRSFTLTADDAGWPTDPGFRAAISGYIDWAVDDVALTNPNDTDVPPSLPVPRWSWDGLRRE
jgi:hypothetical protein